MHNRRLLIEAIWLTLSLLVTVVLFWGGAWAYPQGADTIWLVGYATLAAVVVMSIPGFRRAATRDARAAR